MFNSGKCYLGIKERLNDLSPSGKQIALYILGHPEKVSKMSLEDMAKSCNTSVSSVVRLCKTLGYAGYKELCRVLAADLALANSETPYQEIRPGDSPVSVFRNTCLSSIHAIENTMTMQDEEQITRAVNLICGANRIDFYGIGTSGLVALDAHNKFLRMGKTGMASFDFHVQLLSAITLKPGNVAVLISYSGETADMIRLLNRIRDTGCTIITITSYGENSLNKQADVRLYTLSTESSYIRSGAMSSRISQMAIIDALFTGVCSIRYNDVRENLDKSQQAINDILR